MPQELAVETVESTFGCVFFSNGIFCDARAVKSYLCSTSKAAEALAILFTLRFAVDKGISKISISLDAKVVIEVLNKENENSRDLSIHSIT
ncbi:hypothetical protein AAC387_Pa11g1876 [Persea americana]